MKLWSSYLKRNLGWIAVILLTIFSMSVIVELNGVHISEWIYGTILCIFFLLVIGGVDFTSIIEDIRICKNAGHRKNFRQCIGHAQRSDRRRLPEAVTDRA